MAAYYNEFDPYAAEWLRNLIKNGLIADGDVDERSILDVAAADLRGYTQCHFFAGIGVWSHALRLAGWPDDRPVWTGSCPCQPFSAAGKGKGFEDERHLWPVFHRLIAECRPAVVFGEQVASKDGLAWLDTVFADLEGSGYAAGAVDMCAAGIGAPHIRQRLWFVAESMADASGSGQQGQGWSGGAQGQRTSECSLQGGLGGLADAVRSGTGNDTGEGVGTETAADSKDGSVSGERLRAGVEGAFRGLADAELHEQRQGGRPGCEGAPGHEPRTEPGGCGVSGGMADASCDGRAPGQRHDQTARQRHPFASTGDDDRQGQARPTNGHWRAADWLHCRDGKWRPVEPGTFPLAHGATARVGRLRAYGNAIVPQVAAQVIGAYLET